jgi:phosphoglycolate phosphatase-like HAD superfamily hydrolase
MLLYYLWHFKQSRVHNEEPLEVWFCGDSSEDKEAASRASQKSGISVRFVHRDTILSAGPTFPNKKAV